VPSVTYENWAHRGLAARLRSESLIAGALLLKNRVARVPGAFGWEASARDASGSAFAGFGEREENPPSLRRSGG